MDEKHHRLSETSKVKRIIIAAAVVLSLLSVFLFRSSIENGAAKSATPPQNAEAQKQFQPRDPLDSLHESAREHSPTSQRDVESQKP